MVSGKYLSCIASEGRQKFLPSTFQRSVEGTFHTNMWNSHFPSLKTVSSTPVWYGEEEVAPSLDKSKESVYYFFPNLKPFSLWPTFLSLMLLASPAVSQTERTGKFCVFTLLPNQYIKILQSWSPTMVPGTDYSDIGLSEF